MSLKPFMNASYFKKITYDNHVVSFSFHKM